MGEWQPIETAPKEERSRFDDYPWQIGRADWVSKVDNIPFSHVGPCIYDGRRWRFINHDFDIFVEPTHYLPLTLPAPLVETEG